MVVDNKINTRLRDIKNKLSDQQYTKKKQEKTNNNKAVLISCDLIGKVILGNLLGVFLDRYFNIAPLFIILLNVLALISFFFQIYKYNK